MKQDQKDREQVYKILVVDDNEENVAILEARLQSRNYNTIAAYDGFEALKKTEEEMPDLILLDVMMPKMDGFEVCKRLKVNPTTRMIPVIMVTAKADAEDIARGLEIGADDYLTKPYHQMELMARVRSMLRIRQAYLDIAELNQTLEQRVREQVVELQRIGRLKRYFSPQLLESLTSDEAEAIMQSHRREITVVFLDLRGFTFFSKRSEPEEVMAVLGEFHGTAGSIIFRHEGTIERFAGDGIMVFFGDPMPMEDHSACAIRMALELRKEVGVL